MHVLQIEHPVPNYDAWKSAFDRDPIDRVRMGVRHYRIMRPAGDSHVVMVELDFASASEAEACLSALRKVWKDLQGTLIFDPTVRIVEVLESRAP